MKLLTHTHLLSRLQQGVSAPLGGVRRKCRGVRLVSGKWYKNSKFGAPQRLSQMWILMNYDGGVGDQLGLTEVYRARRRLGTPGATGRINEAKEREILWCWAQVRRVRRRRKRHLRRRRRRQQRKRRNGKSKRSRLRHSWTRRCRTGLCVSSATLTPPCVQIIIILFVHIVTTCRRYSSSAVFSGYV